MRTAAAIILFTLTAFGQSAAVQEKADRAKAALIEQRFDEAIRLYTELVRDLPAVPGLKMNLGMACYNGGRFADASKYLALAVQGDPSLTPAWLVLGAAQLETGHPLEAIKSTQRYLKEKPGEPEALQVLGDAYLRTKQYRRAVSVFEQLTAKQPDSPKSWYGLGRAYESLSGEMFAKLEKVAPESGYWFALIGDSRVAQKQHYSAFYFYRKALEKQPGLRGIHFAISRVYRETDHPDWAETELQKESALGDPDCAKEPFVCDYLNGRLREVLDRANKQASAESYYWAVQASNQLAVASFSRLSSLPPSLEVHELKAEIHRNQGRHWEAVNEWKQALALAPDDPRIKHELAVALYLKRDYDEAKSVVDELLRTEPNSGELNYLAGDILLYRQKPEEAIPFLEKAVKASPDIMGAHSALGRAYMSTGQAAKAIPQLKLALPGDEDGSVHFQLGQAYLKTGQQELAFQMMAKYQAIVKESQRENREVGEEVKITPP
jgi:tetratricopeptide (TPR) repeat protein